MSHRVATVLALVMVLTVAIAATPVLSAQSKTPTPSRPSPSPQPGPDNNSSRPTGGFGFPGSSGIGEQPIPLVIKVVLPDERPVGQHVEVMLLATAGNTVTSYFTNSEGEVTFNTIHAGSYRIRIRGAGVEDTTTDSFYLDQFGGNRMQWVHVKPEEDKANAVVSTQPMVSASELNAPDKAKKEFEKGNDALVAGDNKKALEHFEKAVKMYPNYGLAYNNLGAAYMRDNNPEQARTSFEKAVEADPQLASAHANLARLKLLDKKPAEAIPMLQRALSTDPTSSEFLFLMSSAQLDVGNYDEAIKYARKVHSQEHKKFAAAHLVAGSAFAAENKIADARAEFQVFLKENPDSPQADKVRAELNRLNAAASAAPVK